MSGGDDEPEPAASIVVLDGGREGDAPAAGRDEELETIELALLTEAVFRRYGLDFRNYAVASLRRRVQLAMHEEGVVTISALTDRLLHDPPAMERLLLRLSINVTSMFRGRRAPAQLSVRAHLARRLRHGRRGLLDGDPPARGGHLRSLPHLRHRLQRSGAAARA
jgi:hypothetical protein